MVEEPDSITVRLDSKPGRTFDRSDIDACLQHTVRKAQPTDE